jgi:heptosyltransferase-2
MKIDPKAIKRVLVIGLSCLGDMLLASAALWNLRLYLKEAHFTLWVGPRALGAVEGDPLWDEVVPYDRQGEYAGLKGRFKAIRRLREGRYDLIVDLRSTLMPLLSGARFAPLWGFKGVFAPQGVHEAERNIAAVASLGVPIAIRRLRFYVPQSSRDAADELLGPALKGRPLVVLNPSGSIPEKRWPVERFCRLGLCLSERYGASVGVLGYLEREIELAKAILEALGEDGLDLTGRHSLPVVGAFLERSALFVTNDTGTLHVASALMVPTVGIYLLRNAARFGPWGGPHVVVASLRDDVREIPLEQVVEACDFLLGESGV